MVQELKKTCEASAYMNIVGLHNKLAIMMPWHRGSILCACKHWSFNHDTVGLIRAGLFDGQVERMSLLHNTDHQTTKPTNHK